MSRVANQKGFTLIEILIASVLLVIAVMAIQAVILHVTQEGIRVNQRSRLQKVARAVIYQLSEEARKYPGVPRDARFDDPNFQAFDDPSIADQSCFTEEGGKTSTSSTDCLFRVSSYRIQMANTTFAAGSDLRPMPLYRLMIRFTYPESGKTKQLIVSQFLTPTLWQ